MIKEIYKGLKIDFHPASFIIGGSWIDEYAKELGERKTFDFIYKNVTKHKNPVFVDIGANIGIYSFINKNKGFILASNLALYGSIFVDFGDYHEVSDCTGEQI